jgi:hypothetical protein
MFNLPGRKQMNIEVGFMFFNDTRCHVGMVMQVKNNSITYVWRNKRQNRLF